MKLQEYILCTEQKQRTERAAVAPERVRRCGNVAPPDSVRTKAGNFGCLPFSFSAAAWQLAERFGRTEEFVWRAVYIYQCEGLLSA